MITNDPELERAEKAVATIKALLRQSRKTMSAESYTRMSRPWLLELQEREREILLYLANIELPNTPASIAAK